MPKRPFVLNANTRAAPEVNQSVDVALALAMADTRADLMDPESGKIDYGAAGPSEAFVHYCGLAGRLRSMDLSVLESRDQRMAFWINVYNAAVIHGIIEFGVKRSVREISGFFDKVVYEIGGHLLSLTEMEHGILRGNRRPPYRWFKPFGKQDPRLPLAVAPMDPRIHFALVCGARSCPPIGFYESARVDSQLDLAAVSFVNSPAVSINRRARTIWISRIFKWYKVDFGGSNAAVVNMLLTYLDQGDDKAFLEKNQDRIRIRYQPYDWSLNE